MLHKFASKIKIKRKLQIDRMSLSCQILHTTNIHAVALTQSTGLVLVIK